MKSHRRAVVSGAMRSGWCCAVAMALGFSFPADAADYRATAEQPTVLYDGPSVKAKPLFLYGRDVPVELIVGSSRVDLQACKLEYSIVSPK